MPAHTHTPIRPASFAKFLRSDLLRKFGAVLLLVLSVVAVATGYEVHRYSRRVDRALAHSPIFRSTTRMQPVARWGHGHRPATLLVADGHLRRGASPAYAALPPELVQAVVAIEDRQFFQHGGVNYFRTAECAVQDTLTLSMACGGSTLTQQLARNTLLTQDKTIRRKVEEILIARRLEARFSKQQLFALYAAQVYLGERGPTPIRGFREAAKVYFNKSLNQLDLAQYALLAGIIQRPNYYNPSRHPDRAAARRNVVLNAMVSTGAITQQEATAAQAEPLDVAILSPDDASPTIQLALMQP